MVRLRTKWNKDKGERSFGDTASALCMSIWKISSERVLNLENEGFETVTNSQRLDVLIEFAIFCIHLFDRRAHSTMEWEERNDFVTALVEHFAGIVQDNRMDTEGPGHYRQGFIELFNHRSDEYSEYRCDSETGEPGFSLRRALGEHVRERMGDKDQQWIPDYVIDKEVPELYETLRKAERLVF